MKRLIFLILSFLALASCSDLKKRVDELEDRVLALEKQCEMLNSNIEALRSIVNALDQADFIKGVTPINVGGTIIGYTLEFRSSPSITIYNGSDGKDAPVIGIRKDGGTYYWTIGDDWLLDEDGNRIAANPKVGISPRLKNEDGFWWISYDNGGNWEKLGQEMPMIIKDIREDADYVYITLISGTEIRLPKINSTIRFEDATVRMICLKHWDTNKDGELSYEEAAEVTSLGTCFQLMDILYFNELQYFTALEKIEDEAFYKSMLQEVTLPGSLKVIGARAFYGTPLLGIVIPECVETIGEGAFYACRKMVYANIPASFTEIPSKLFAGCWKLQEITLPEKTVKIGAEAFHECFEMADVTLPSSLDTLENRAFARCKNFTEVILPQSVRSIGFSAFYECEKASRIELPDHITIIDHMLLYGCQAMESFTVPSKVDTIGWFAFWECTNLKSLIMKPAVPPVVRTDNTGAGTLFKDCPEDLKIYVPDVEAYRNDPYWSRYSNIILPVE